MANDGRTDMLRDEGSRWTVRGIDRALVRDVTAAARAERLTLGEWVSRALRTALERPKGERAREIGADQPDPVLERLASLETTMATVESTVGLLDAYVRELRQDRERLGGLERGRPAVHPRPAPSEANGKAAARPRGKGGKPLSAETDKLIADMIRDGRPYSEIASKAGVSVGAITKIRKRLGI